MEVKVAITLQKGQGNRELKIIKPEGERDEEMEVIISHKVVIPKWKTWSWHVLYENPARLL